MMLRVSMASVVAMMVACGGAGEGTADKAGADKAAAPAPAVAPAPVEKPLELKATVDIGAAVLAADKDDSSWQGISMQVPEGAKVETLGGSPTLFVNDAMSVGLGGERDIADKKKQAESDSLQKVARFLVDEPDTILWETKGFKDASNFLFVANIKLGDKVKSCQTAGYGTFTQQAAEKLLEACRGMKLAQ